MSRIVDKLREAGHLRNTTLDPAPAAQKTLFNNSTPSASAPSPGGAMIITPKLLFVILGCWALSLVVAILIAVSGGVSQRAVLRDLTTAYKKQNEKIRILEKTIVDSETRQAKAAKVINDQVQKINTRLIKTEGKVEGMSASYNSLSKDMQRLQFSSQSVFDKYISLSNEVKTLRLMTVPSSASVMEPGRSKYGKNN